MLTDSGYAKIPRIHKVGNLSKPFRILAPMGNQLKKQSEQDNTYGTEESQLETNENKITTSDTGSGNITSIVV